MTLGCHGIGYRSWWSSEDSIGSQTVYYRDDQAYVCAGNRKKFPDSRFDDPKKCRFFPVICPLITRIPGIETKTPLFSRRKNLCGWFVLWLYSIKVNLSFLCSISVYNTVRMRSNYASVFALNIWVLKKWPHRAVGRRSAGKIYDQTTIYTLRFCQTRNRTQNPRFKKKKIFLRRLAECSQ